MRDSSELETPYASPSGEAPSVMCNAERQRHPIGTMAHTLEKLVVLDARMARLRTKTTKESGELRKHLLTEMEGLAVVAVHDLARLMWDLRGGYKETYAD